ncbi:MAG: insulinase family protein [Caldilineae bacterium]|nr:MAG: insulinase family protein [Caldilineae bacterium]
MNLQSYDAYTLANGLTLLCAPMPAVRSVSLGLIVRIGSRYEPPALAGISHFIEHMLFKGCRDWPSPLAIASEIEGRGGYLNASTGQEFTSFWIKIGSGHWQQSLKLLAHMIRFPLFDPVECERERNVILDEIRMYRDLPEDLVSILCNRALWGDHPLGQDVAGEIESVSAITLDDLRDFHHRGYRPNRVILSVAGAIESQAVYEYVRALLADWEPAPDSLSFPPAPSTYVLPAHRIQVQDSQQAHLQLAAPGLPRLHPDRYALSLLNAALGEATTSRLWQRLREELGVAYSIGSYVNMFEDCGVVGIYGGCDPRRLIETLDEIMRVWQSLQEAPITDEELARLKEYVRGRLELGSEDSSTVASWWARQVAAGTEPLTLDEVIAATEQVTAADIRRLAQQLWQPQRLALGYVGPLDDERILVDWLQARSPLLPLHEQSPAQTGRQV